VAEIVLQDADLLEPTTRFVVRRLGRRLGLRRDKNSGVSRAANEIANLRGDFALGRHIVLRGLGRRIGVGWLGRSCERGNETLT
jgi:hypothetical protein